MALAGLYTNRSSVIHIPDFVINGDKFLKWDDVSCSLFVMFLCCFDVLLLVYIC